MKMHRTIPVECTRFLASIIPKTAVEIEFSGNQAIQMQIPSAEERDGKASNRRVTGCFAFRNIPHK